MHHRRVKAPVAVFLGEVNIVLPGITGPSGYVGGQNVVEFLRGVQQCACRNNAHGNGYSTEFAAATALTPRPPPGNATHLPL